MGRVKVRHDGNSKVKLVFAGLNPNSLYGVWQFNVGAAGTDGPFGGIPNIFVTDAEGSAEMERVLPYDATSVIDHLLVVYHSDQRIYGGVPSLHSGGFVHHAQLSIDVAGGSH